MRFTLCFVWQISVHWIRQLTGCNVNLCRPKQASYKIYKAYSTVPISLYEVLWWDQDAEDRLYAKLCIQLADSVAAAGGLTKAILWTNQRCSFAKTLLYLLSELSMIRGAFIFLFFCLVSHQGLTFFITFLGLISMKALNQLRSKGQHF